MHRAPAVPRFANDKIVHIRGVDHPESLAVGPRGELYTTGTGCQVYRVDVATNRAEQFATTANRCLGQAVDAAGNLYCAETGLGAVVKVTPDGAVSTYATGPEGRPFLCANYPAFDRRGALYLSDSGDWSGAVNGRLYKIEPGGGAARLWYPGAIDTPNAIALDAAERYLYLVETFGAGIARVAIDDDGSAGGFERVLHMPRHVPDGIAFDEHGRLWIACHRPDAIYVFDLAQPPPGAVRRGLDGRGPARPDRRRLRRPRARHPVRRLPGQPGDPPLRRRRRAWPEAQPPGRLSPSDLPRKREGRRTQTRKVGMGQYRSLRRR